MKLKRLQVVETVNGRKMLSVDGGTPMALADFVAERGFMVSNRLLYKRLNNRRPFKFTRPLDVLALMAISATYSTMHDQGVGIARVPVDASTTSLEEIASAMNVLSEGMDTADTVAEIQAHYISRYTSLFTRFYGNQLWKKGIVNDL